MVFAGQGVGKADARVVPEVSRFFSTVSVEERSTYNTASDGDLWPSAWSDDGYLYSVNGDGKGFDLDAPWSDIVVNKLAGHPDNNDLTGERVANGAAVGEVWGDPEKYNRKPTGMVSVDGVLYLAVQDLNKEPGPNIFNDAPAATILRSDDKGKTWTWNREAPMLDDYALTTIMFLDYGRDGENNTFDDYVYAYGLDYNWRDSFADTVPDPTRLYLARMPKDGVQDLGTWQFYTGNLDGKARWSRPGDITARRPVLQDERRVYSETLFPLQPSNMTVLSQGSVVYNKPLDRYIYTSWTEYTFEFYEAPTPWGPWKRFLSKDFGVYPWFPEHQGGYTTVIPSKFISGDGREMWLNSNTFVGGIQNYNLSLRRLNVTPYVPTRPANMPDASNLASPSVGENVTPVSRSSVHFGNVGIVNDGSRSGSEDSWNGEAKPVDWWGYTWPRAYNMNQLVYTTGRMFGNDGGWFEDVRVQVRRNFVWRDVEDLSVTPDYAGDGSVGSNVPYTFSFKDTWGDGIRVIGVPGGIGKFTSMAELEVYYSAQRDMP